MTPSTTEQPPIASSQNLTCRFPALTAVDQLNLEISRGEIFGLVGPDGAGKTTTLRLFCGLIKPTEGSAQVVGYDVCRDIDKVRDRIGYMAQRFGLYLDLSVQENMTFYADLYGLPQGQRHQLMGLLLKMTRMEPFRERQAGKLSGGMKQKLALMCTLLHQPDILFLDEPTTGLDPVSRRDFWEILYQLVTDGVTVLLTTAYLDEAERCNRVGLMDQGKLIRCDSPKALQTELEEVCYQVKSSHPRTARQILSRASGVLSVEFAGAVLHLFLSPSSTTPAELERSLEEAGCGPAQLTPIKPSLEDVFIALVRKQGGVRA